MFQFYNIYTLHRIPQNFTNATKPVPHNNKTTIYTVYTIAIHDRIIHLSFFFFMNLEHIYYL